MCSLHAVLHVFSVPLSSPSKLYKYIYISIFPLASLYLIAYPVTLLPFAWFQNFLLSFPVSVAVLLLSTRFYCGILFEVVVVPLPIMDSQQS
jgi:hypothetical protein